MRLAARSTTWYPNNGGGETTTSDCSLGNIATQWRRFMTAAKLEHTGRNFIGMMPAIQGRIPTSKKKKKNRIEREREREQGNAKHIEEGEDGEEIDGDDEAVKEGGNVH